MRRLLCGAIAIVAACGHGGADGDENAPAAPAAVRATVVPARLATFTETVAANGVVAPRPGHFAELGPPAPTRVTAIRVAPGDRVRAGDTLVVFDRAPFDAAAHAADVALAAARAASDRATRLVGAGILPQKDADDAAQSLAEAEAADVAARRSADLAVARAPFAGVVTRVDAVLGAPVDPAAPVVAVADPAALDILLPVAVDAAGRIAAGDAALVTAADLPGDTLGTGRVSSVGAAVDSTSRAVIVRVRLARPRRPLKIGEPVSARITVATRPGAVVVPDAALVPADSGFRVFVVDTEGVAHARDVVVGGRSGGIAEIRRGLAAGERVVAAGAYGVTDSARILPARP